jgi:N-acetylneuraminic acid mutarotase
MKKYFILPFVIISFSLTNAQYTWVNKTPFPGGGFWVGASFVINGIGYIVGGATNPSPLTFSNQTWQYNPASDTWTQKANYPHTIDGGVYFSINGTGYQVGGGDSAGYFYGDNYAYNPIADTWTMKAAFPENGIGSGFYFVIDGIAYVGAGNRNTANGSVSAYSYNPVSDTWSSIADYPGNPSSGLCTFTIDSFGYAGMGGDGNGNFYTDMHRYNPLTNTWSAIASFPGKARFADKSAFVVNGKAFVGSGETLLNGGSSPYCLGDYYMYDPASDTWTSAPGLLGPPRYGATAFSFGDSAYLVGGYNQDGHIVYSYVDEFKPAGSTCSVTDTTHIVIADTTHLSVTDTLFITVNVGIAPNNTTNILEVYPNPAHNQLYINTGNYATMSTYSLKITNPLGQTVFQTLINQQLFNVNIAGWSTGVYFLQILDASNAIVETKEIVIH